ncbi:MAG: heparin lyase I family protein [Rhizobiaceae bacterium]
MKKAHLPLSAFVMGLAITANTITPPVAAGKSINLRDDCPRAVGSVKRSGGTYVFTLKHGQKGGCSTDRMARHGAPYWERAELKSAYFKKGRTYTFSFDVNFSSKTKSSNRTSFFQVHQYHNKKCRSCAPAIMLKVNANGSVIAAVLKRNGHHAVKRLGLRRSQIAGKWASFAIKMGTGKGLNALSISANGRKVFRGKVYIEPKGSIIVKTGLYRPGKRSDLPTDRVSIRRLRYSSNN